MSLPTRERGLKHLCGLHTRTFGGRSPYGSVNWNGISINEFRYVSNLSNHGNGDWNQKSINTTSLKKVVSPWIKIRNYAINAFSMRFKNIVLDDLRLKRSTQRALPTTLCRFPLGMWIETLTATSTKSRSCCRFPFRSVDWNEFALLFERYTSFAFPSVGAWIETSSRQRFSLSPWCLAPDGVRWMHSWLG